jgi:hypothetical protein
MRCMPRLNACLKEKVRPATIGDDEGDEADSTVLPDELEGIEPGEIRRSNIDRNRRRPVAADESAVPLHRTTGLGTDRDGPPASDGPGASAAVPPESVQDPAHGRRSICRRVDPDRVACLYGSAICVSFELMIHRILPIRPAGVARERILARNRIDISGARRWPGPRGDDRLRSSTGRDHQRPRDTAGYNDARFHCPLLRARASGRLSAHRDDTAPVRTFESTRNPGAIRARTPAQRCLRPRQRRTVPAPSAGSASSRG